MTLKDFALSITNDATYRATVTARARSGTLPPDVELFILELADGRLPMSGDYLAAPAQSRTLALVRPLAPAEEEVQS